MIHTYKIPEVNLRGFEEKIAGLNATAKKLGCEEIPYVISSHDFEKIGEGKFIKVFTVTLKGSLPKLAGWTFLAKVERSPLEGSNFVLSSPLYQEKLDPKYRTSDMKCDHCNTIRDRKTCYILRHDDGREILVGSTCLADFLGHPDPHAIARFAEILYSFPETIQEYEESSPNSGRVWMQTGKYLDYVAATIRQEGWLSRSRASEISQLPTADRANNFYFHLSDREIEIDEADQERRKAALYWARLELLQKDELSDYEHNLTTAVISEYFPSHLKGIVASLFAYYDRSREIERKKRENTSQFIGKVGERIPLENLLCTVSRVVESNYGPSFLHRFEDSKGNALTWFSSSQILMQGKTYSGVGTIKAHEDFRGTKQTLITRCKFQEV